MAFSSSTFSPVAFSTPPPPPPPPPPPVAAYEGLRSVVPVRDDPCQAKVEFVKRPLDVEFYGIDYASKYLVFTGDTPGNLLAFNFAANPDGFVAISQTAIGQPVPGGVLWMRSAAGVEGGAYKITARIGTAQGREKEWSITVLVREL